MQPPEENTEIVVLTQLFKETKVMNLTDAITAAEQAQAAYSGAAAITVNDQSTVQAVQAKLDAAGAQVTSDQADQAAAAATFNASLDALMAAAAAAKV